MIHFQLPIITFLYFFFFLNLSILIFASNFPNPNSLVDKIANYDHGPDSMPWVPKLRKLAFGRVNTIATGVTIVIMLLNIIVYKLRQVQEANLYEQLNIRSEQLCRRFLLADILSATNHFDDALVIGQGGFGKVYKGVIDNGAMTVAIKRLHPMSRQGAPEFWTEIDMLSKFRHSHLVSLIGYCDNCNEMILVYEYMINGTLDDHLHKFGRNGNNSTLSWVQRLKICIGAARGVDYLHSGTGIKHRVIHRDVKSANILLDENWEAKISDFGLSKTGPANQSCSHISTNIKGTFGYVDMEYFFTRRLTKKSDVYAFGVVLFEVLCGRRAVDTRLDEEQWGLAGWAQKCIKDGRLEHIIDASLRWEIMPNSLTAFAQIANQCLNYHSKKRPTMAEVVASLESALALQQRTDSSIIEGEIFNISGTYKSQENVDYNAINDDKQIDEITRLGDANSMQPSVKPARIMAFTRMVRPFIRGKTQVTPVHNNVKPPKNRKGSNNNSEKSKLQNKDGNVQQLPLRPETGNPSVKMFTYIELQAATGNFGPIVSLGKGEFGEVFKVWVNEKTYAPTKVGVGMAIAIKKFGLEGFEEHISLQSEVELLGKLSHPNLVNFLGYCMENMKFVVVYEYMHNGSLESHLFNDKAKPLPWVTRLKIAIGAARGLAFLHSTKKQDMYRQFKTHNILLDWDFNAKLSDIEFPQISYSFNNYYVPGVRRVVKRTNDFSGAPPEYLKTGHLNETGQVYNFGVVLLEIFTGMRAADVIRRSGKCDLVRGALALLSGNIWVTVIDPRLAGRYHAKAACKYAQLVVKCVGSRPMDRPRMDQVLGTLENILNMSNFN